MSRARQVLLSLAVLGVTGFIAFLGTYSAFTAADTNDGNTITSGTVSLTDDDSGSAMYSVTNQKPGDTVQKCIKVTYAGSLDADVRFYTADTIGAVGEFVNLTITPGSGATFPDCTGFTADGADLFSGTLASFATTHSNWTNGLVDYPSAGSKWVTNDAVVYRFTLTLQDDDDAQGDTSNSHAFTWEARNQ